jgi:hypothetical protein
MKSVGQVMPPSHFAEFRQYFPTNPFRQTKGPSGAFTARFAILDILISGDELPDEYFTYLSDNLSYFPRLGRREIADAMELAAQGKSLRSIAHHRVDSEPIQTSLDEISNTIRRFRGEHYAGVRTQIPQALEGVLPGTGGEIDVSRFLRDRIAIKHGRRNNE